MYIERSSIKDRRVLMNMVCFAFAQQTNKTTAAEDSCTSQLNSMM